MLRSFRQDWVSWPQKYSLMGDPQFGFRVWDSQKYNCFDFLSLFGLEKKRYTGCVEEQRFIQTRYLEHWRREIIFLPSRSPCSIPDLANPGPFADKLASHPSGSELISAGTVILY